MPFSIEQYRRWRPYLYHLTARANTARIRASQRLESAAVLLDAAGRATETYERRPEMLPVAIASQRVLIRDQRPLHAGNVDFAPGWEFVDLLWDLNRRVFFWSGNEKGVGGYGKRHFARYEEERPAILRIALASLLAENPEMQPQFCRYNSGSPRAVNGRKSPRGPETFLPADRCPYPPGDVVEVTFLGQVSLPADTEVSDRADGPWARFMG